MASATTGSDARKNEGEFVCPECGNTYTTQHALGGHLTKHAREQRNAEGDGKQFSVKAQIAAAMREAVAPLQAQLDDINKQIAVRQRELMDLRSARTQLEGVLKKVNPTAFPAKASAAGGSARDVANRSLASKLATMRKLVADKPELFVEGITANALADYWKEQQLKPPTSLQTVRACFETLRDEGVLRADKIVKGGGMAWKLVNHDGGNDGS